MQLTGVRHKGSQCITEKLLLVKFHFFGVHFDGPWANGEGAPPLPVLDEVRCPEASSGSGASACYMLDEADAGMGPPVRALSLYTTQA